MQSFRTIVEPENGNQGLIDHRRAVVMMGSCFTENVGARLQSELFDVVINPTGTLYNPASVASTLLDLLYDRDFTADELFEHNGMWHSYSHHSRFSGSNPEAVLAKMNSAMREAREAMTRASVLIITFGTAWIYRLADSNRVVANCHKMPAATFKREMLTVTQTLGLWKKMLREIAARYPELKVVFTVSPIRHLADGAHGNQVSKSTLLLAVNKLAEENPGQVLYFPSYEIMLDDLRDYRFYAADMVHPSEVAVDYIYDRFKSAFMDDATVKLAGECGKLAKRLTHRHIAATPEDVARFAESTEAVKRGLLTEHPYLERAIVRAESRE
jgi:hypothetical protein